MRLNRIALGGFRNYEDFSAEFSPEMNVICGENAQGKTNLVEAIAYLSGAKSHRARSDQELIGFSRREASIQAEVESRGREFMIHVSLRKQARRIIEVNHVKLKKASELSGVLTTVLFCPEDLSLVKDGAAVRRRFLDDAISQLRPKYADALARYQKLLDHKTRILRDAAEKPSLLSVLPEFEEGLARTGALLIHYRAHFIRRLNSHAMTIAADFSGGRDSLALRYETVSTIVDPFAPPLLLYEQIREHQEGLRRAELASRSCLSGPHKDDLVAELDGISARQFASQGQSRTIALSLKLAQRELFAEDTGSFPVLLLDDVLSELDAKRQDFVLERIRGGQVFLTGCSIPNFERENHRVLAIEQGRLRL